MRTIFKNTAKFIVILIGLNISTLKAQNNNFRMLEPEYNYSGQLFSLVPHPSWSKTSLNELPKILGELYGITYPFTFRVRSEESEDLYTFTRVEQMIGNYPVVGGELILKRDKAGSLEVIMGTLMEPSGIAEPVKTASEALDIAHKVLNISEKNYFISEAAYVRPDISLKYTNIQGVLTNKLVLCYELIISTQAPAVWYVYVNAVTGNIEYQYNGLPHANGTGTTIYSGTKSINTKKVGNAFQLIDTVRNIMTRNFMNIPNTDVTVPSGGFIVSDPNNNFDSANQKYAIDAHWGMGVTYDYYLDIHKRKSYDNAGSLLKVNVRWDKDYDNAFFHPSTNQMYFGKGSGAAWGDWGALDCVGHEFTHSLVNATANLIYRGLSGALNESFADIFGHCIEVKGKGMDWQILEEIKTPATPGPPARDMSNPNAGEFNDPDTYLGTGWKDPSPSAWDIGGVHSNSGVQNFWFYLLTVGGSGTNDAPHNDAYSVTGIGQDKSEKIAFRALTKYLSGNSDFKAARKAALLAAQDLYGKKSNEYQQTCNAWFAVGVGEKCCTGDDSLILSFKVTDTKCPKSKDGEIELTVKNKLGSTLTLCEYRWFKGDTASSILAKTKDIQNRDSGTYIVIVKDTVNKCEATDKTKIKSPEEVKVTVSGQGTYEVPCKRSFTVTLAASASGGTPNTSGDPYNYNWANGIKEVVLSGPNGFSRKYTAVATDKNGCKGEGSAIVTYVPIVCSYDPNEMVGPPSYGDAKWVSVKATLPYKIRYENDPKFATGPAQKVTINHKLDSTVDPNTFRLGDFGFYKYNFTVPNNTSTYNKRLDIRDSFGIYLDVTAGIDVTNRNAFWVFESIDPKTGVAPTNGNKGFLAVNDTSKHNGEGFVNYTIRPRSKSKTGDSIRAMAVIVFDDNPDVKTPRIHNLIDALPPTSSIKSMPPVIDSSFFKITLRGKDDNGGSGLGYFDIYSSENGGTYTLHSKEIADTVISFQGNFGSTYKLYSLASDNTGNREANKKTSDVTFSVASKNFFKPLAGNSLCTGDTLKIRWFKSFFNPISLEYSADSGKTYTTFATNLAGNDTLYRWKIPANIVGVKKYFIRSFASANNTIIDTSDYFELKQGPSFNLGKDTAFCENSTFNLVLNPGGGFSSYKWSDSSSNQTLTVSNYGTYWVRVKSNTGCKATDLITVSKNLLPVVSNKDVVNVKCFGNNTGSIDLTVVSGHPTFTYLWSNSQTTQDLSNLLAGNYKVTITDTKGCSIKDSTIITQPSAALSSSKTQNNVLCFGNATGSIDLNPSGGTVGYTYAWTASNGGSVPSGQATSQDLTGLVAGTYSVTITDANGCTATNSATITQPSAALSSSKTQVNVLCFGNATGSIDLTVSGGTSGYSYAWTASNGGSVPSGQASLQDLTGLVAGTYTVIITDANNCTTTNSATITQPSAALSSSRTFVNILCFGNNTGSIDLSVSGGTGGYTYAWTASGGGSVPSGQSTNQDLTGLIAGTYSVTVTDANNCKTTNSATITQPTAALSSSRTQVNVKCFGNATGSIDLSVAGGTAGYTYAWTASGGGSVPSGQASLQDLTNLIAGTYSVTITDANGCTTTNSATITQPSAALSSSRTQVNVSCFGLSDGSIDLSVSGGTAGYTYAWTASSGGVVPGGQATSQDLSGLLPGVYSVTITDANGCTATNSATITQPSAALSSSRTFVNVLCFGNNTGSIDLSVSGGTVGYTYAWTASGGGVVPSGQSTSQDLTGLVAGTYSVTIKDANNCSTSNSATITQPTAALSSSRTQVNVLCFGNSTGSIDLTVSGGTAGYTYAWTASGGGSVPSGQANSQDLTGLVAGTYSVTITDANGCTTTNSATITQPSAALSSSRTQVNVSCFGLSDGSIDLSVSGGTAGYTYAWTASSGGVVPSGQSTSQDLSGLLPGVYSVTITDANGCTATNSATITQPSAALSSSKTSVNVLCFGNNTGSIDLSVSGGTAGYTYVWTASGGGSVPSGQSTNQDLTGLIAGNYNVTIRDARGCVISDGASISQPSSALSSSRTQVNVLCFGNATGAIDLTVSGGTAGYTYVWTASGGGSVPSGQSTSQDLINIIAGTYSVTVTDANGCTTTNSATITQPSSAVTSSRTQVNVLCFGNATGSIDLTPSGGTPGYTYSWSASGGGVVPSGQSANQDLTGLVAGTYNVTVRDANNCATTNSATITQPSAALSSSRTQVNVLCFGNNTGSIDLSVSGGTAGYTYVWTASGGGSVPSGQSTNQDLTGLIAGTYSVTVTDANNCTTTNSATITQPAAALSSSKTQVNVLCFGNATGSIDLTVSGGTAGYTYSWTASGGGSVPSGQAGNQDLTGLVAGTYSVTVTDANGCTTTNSATITQPAAALNTTKTQVNVLCFGNATGAIDLTVGGGTAAYSYLWTASSGGVVPSGQAGNQDLTALVAGTYSVLVTDANGCTTTNSATITQPSAALSNSKTQVNVLCFGNATGSIDLSVAGGTNPYFYLWTASSGGVIPTGQALLQDLSGLVAGTYSVAITDNNGCTSSTSVTITQPLAPLALSKTHVDVLCYGNNTGSVDITITGGTLPYTYAWSSGESTQDISSKITGKYKVVVTDKNLCVISDSVFITQPAAPLSNTLSMVPVNCFAGTDGSTDLSVNGGTVPYSFLWSNGKTTEDLSGLATGSYSVIVTDANGCKLLDTIIVTQPAAPLSTSILKADVKCFGGNDGSADLSVSGGTTPYVYLWSSGATTEDITSRIAGKYLVTITDKNLCIIKDSVVISQPLAPLSSSISASAVNCFGGSDGSVTLTILGGTVPYTYSWSNGASTKDITALILGKYKVIVTDKNNCILKDSIVVSQPGAPLASTKIVADAKCNGSLDGSINLSVTGGTTPYTFSWSNAQTTEDIAGLGAGKYVVTITDKNLCKLKDSAVINHPTQLVIAIDGTTANLGVNNGKVWVIPSGATPPYSFVWNNTAPNNDTIYNVGMGTYIVTVTDANGCQISDTFEILEAPKTEAIKVFPNPSRGFLTVTNLESFGLDLPIYFELYDLVGKLQMSFEVIGQDVITFNLDDGLYNNSYILRMRNDRYDEKRKVFLLR